MATSPLGGCLLWQLVREVVNSVAHWLHMHLWAAEPANCSGQAIRRCGLVRQLGQYARYAHCVLPGAVSLPVACKLPVFVRFPARISGPVTAWGKLFHAVDLLTDGHLEPEHPGSIPGQWRSAAECAVQHSH